MRAEEYVNWIQCLSCDIWCMRNVLEGDARQVTLNLPILRLKTVEQTMHHHSSLGPRPFLYVDLCACAGKGEGQERKS